MTACTTAATPAATNRGEEPMTDLTTYAEMADVLDRLPEEVQTIRRSRGASLRDVQAATGVSSANLSKIEKRQTCPGLGTVVALLRWMDAAANLNVTDDE